MEFGYDVIGNRISKTVDADGDGAGSATTTKFAYDSFGNAWVDFTGTNTVVGRHIFGDGQDALIAKIVSGTTNWYGQDILGSTRDLFGATGSLIDHLDYSVFGKLTYESASGSDRYLWTSREYDAEIDLQYNRARYYDQTTGRWISQDPLGFDAGDSNLYRYVNNNPLFNTDPSGCQGYPYLPPNTPPRRPTDPPLGAANVKRLWDAYYEEFPDRKTLPNSTKDQSRMPRGSAFGTGPINYQKAPEYSQFFKAGAANGVPSAYLERLMRTADGTPFDLGGCYDGRQIAAKVAIIGGCGAVGAGIGLIGGPKGSAIGGLTGLIVGSVAVTLFPPGGKMETCADWIKDFQRNLIRDIGPNPLQGSNGGIAKMGRCYWDCGDGTGEEHSTWKIVFKNKQTFYIDFGFLQGGLPGPLVGARRISSESDVPKTWRVIIEHSAPRD